MDVIYRLIPGMVVLGLLMVGVLIWAIKKGQYEDLEGDGQRILMDFDEDESGQGAQKRKADPRNWPDAD